MKMKRLLSTMLAMSLLLSAAESPLLTGEPVFRTDAAAVRTEAAEETPAEEYFGLPLPTDPADAVELDLVMFCRELNRDSERNEFYLYAQKYHSPFGNDFFDHNGVNGPDSDDYKFLYDYLLKKGTIRETAYSVEDYDTLYAYFNKWLSREDLDAYAAKRGAPYSFYYFDAFHDGHLDIQDYNAIWDYLVAQGLVVTATTAPVTTTVPVKTTAPVRTTAPSVTTVTTTYRQIPDSELTAEEKDLAMLFRYVNGKVSEAEMQAYTEQNHAGTDWNTFFDADKKGSVDSRDYTVMLMSLEKNGFMFSYSAQDLSVLKQYINGSISPDDLDDYAENIRSSYSYHYFNANQIYDDDDEVNEYDYYLMQYLVNGTLQFEYTAEDLEMVRKYLRNAVSDEEMYAYGKSRAYDGWDFFDAWADEYINEKDEKLIEEYLTAHGLPTETTTTAAVTTTTVTTTTVPLPPPPSDPGTAVELDLLMLKKMFRNQIRYHDLLAYAAEYHAGYENTFFDRDNNGEINIADYFSLYSLLSENGLLSEIDYSLQDYDMLNSYISGGSADSNELSQYIADKTDSPYITPIQYYDIYQDQKINKADLELLKQLLIRKGLLDQSVLEPVVFEIGKGLLNYQDLGSEGSVPVKIGEVATIPVLIHSPVPLTEFSICVSHNGMQRNGCGFGGLGSLSKCFSYGPYVYNGAILNFKSEDAVILDDGTQIFEVTIVPLRGGKYTIQLEETLDKYSTYVKDSCGDRPWKCKPLIIDTGEPEPVEPELPEDPPFDGEPFTIEIGGELTDDYEPSDYMNRCNVYGGERFTVPVVLNPTAPFGKMELSIDWDYNLEYLGCETGDYRFRLENDYRDEACFTLSLDDNETFPAHTVIAYLKFRAPEQNSIYSIRIGYDCSISTVRGTEYPWQSKELAVNVMTNEIIEPPPVPEVKYGDANGDGTITNKDVIMLQRYIAGGWNVTIDEKAADVNNDGTVNNKDVILLRRYIAGGWNVTLGSS